MSSTISSEIAQIIKTRNERAKDLECQLASLETLRAAIVSTVDSVHALRQHRDCDPELREKLETAKGESLYTRIDAVRKELEKLHRRYSRTTINVGISGRIGVGKSTLLQTISGLGNDEIPTGDGYSVTAVRSKIFHSSTYRHAILELHTFDTFLSEVLEPYHKVLEISGPHTRESFRSFHYPDVNALGEKHATDAPALARLKELQASLSTYEKHLTGGTKILSDLGELRYWVAYPKGRELEASRRYAAVRDVRIECSFPHDHVTGLGFIDLPGLGEQKAAVDKYHLEGLREGVDVVVLATVPGQTRAEFDQVDQDALKRVAEEASPIPKRDFVFIFINEGVSRSPEREQMLKEDIAARINGGRPDSKFRVLSANGMNRDSVGASLLAPLLEHLSKSLAGMDAAMASVARSEAGHLAAGVRDWASGLEGVLRDANLSSVEVAEKLEELTSKLREDMSEKLDPFVKALRDVARKEGDPEFVQAVFRAEESIQAWIAAGLGAAGESSEAGEAWCVNALRKMRTGKGSAGFALDEFNRIRVEISKHFCKLDIFFQHQIDSFLVRITEVLRPLMGTVVPEDVRPGHDWLSALRDEALAASTPCTAIVEALEDVLRLSVGYRSHLHPRVRQQLDDLILEVEDPQTGELRHRVVAEVSEEGANELYREIQDLATQAAYRTRQALLAEGQTMGLILHAAAEQFEDALIRSETSIRDFRRFTRSHLDRVWPGVFKRLTEHHKLYTKVRKNLATLRDHPFIASGETL